MRVRFKKLALALVSVGLVTGLAGCGGGGGRSGPATTNPIAQSTSTASDVTIEFVDAITGLPVKDLLTVTFSGASFTADEVREPKVGNDGKYLLMPASVQTRDGLIAALAFFDGNNDSFKVEASSADWLLSGTVITPGANNSIKATIKLMKAGTVVAADNSYAVSAAGTSANASGTVASTASASVNDPNVGAASIELPAGTIAKGAAAGALTVSVVRAANSSDPLLLSSNSGGRTFSVGNREGVARFTITDSTSKAITDFENQELTLSIDLPAGSKLPGTNTALVGGETNYPIWYYDETSKQWAEHKDASNNPIYGTVSRSGTGFKVSFKSNHLSLWSLNATYDANTTCVLSTVNLLGRPAGDATPLSLRFQGSSFDQTIGPVTDNSLSLLYAPKQNLTVTVTSPSGVTPAPTSVDFSNCPSTAVNLTLSGLVAPTPATLTVTVTESCSNAVDYSRPSPTNVHYEYKLPTGLFTTVGGFTGDDGIIDMSNIPSGTTGTLKIWNQYKTPSAGYIEYSNYVVNAPTTSKSEDFPVLNCITGS